MKYTKIDPQIQRQLRDIIKDHPPLSDIIQTIDLAGGKTLLVGGAVRDLFLSLPLKDLDIEIHGLSLDQLYNILKQFGSVSTVGKVYGVLRLHGLDIDFSVPRADESGRKPIVKIDPFMAMQHAFSRRDLTINAMGIDLMTHELIDPFNGLQDIKNKILRVPDAEKFIEDPLRFYRVFQFLSRFNMKPDKELDALCKDMDISSVSKERIDQEFQKWLLKSKKPSQSLDWLDSIGRLNELLPELAALKQVPQDPEWHPEGDVFEHTKQTLDAAAQLDYKNDSEKLKIIYAALCHDLGKVSTTEELDGRLRALGHEQESETLAKKLLKRITNNKELIDTVKKLVRYHMQPGLLPKSKAKPAAYKRLANKLAPEATLEMLAKVALADRRGRNKQKGKPLTDDIPVIDQFLQRAKKAQVLFNKEEPVLQGRDLLDVMEAGPQMGKVLKKAYTIQIEKGIKDKQELKKRALQK